MFLFTRQHLTFIGAQFNTILLRVYPKEENIKLKIKLVSMLALTSATAMMFLCLLRTMASQLRLITYRMFYMRPANGI